MASALHLFAAQRGMETGTNISSAFRQQAYAQLMSESVQLKMSEISRRADMNIKEIHTSGERVVAEQTAAFISGGVDMTGSSMSVISDTLSNAAKAAYIARRESDYELEALSGEKGQFKAMASKSALQMGIATSIIGGASGFAGDKYRYESAQPRSGGRKAIGIGEGER